MAESIVSDIVVKLLGYIGQSVAQKIAPYFGGREKLNELQQTMVMIQARLDDAERRQEAEEGALIKSWLRRLKRVLYRLEDLFEEVIVADKRNEQRAFGKLTKAVCHLTPLKLNNKVFKETHAIMGDLRLLKNEMDILQLRDSPGQLNSISRREETYSYIREEEVMGRDEDKAMIVRMLLDSDNIEENVSVIAIVGMGGLGKTTLAQLAYNDKSVKEHFEIKFWESISNQMFALKKLLRNILLSIIGENQYPQQQSSMETLQSRFREVVDGKKFLLVLDDVWDENHERWHQLKRLLCGCKQGSKILVTSRSKVVASNMGAAKPLELKVLTKEKSWELFKSIALRKGQEETNPNLESIGKEIVKKCGDVPLAIKTIAGLLLSKDTEEEWVHFKDKEIGMIDQEENDIMPTLKLSYDHLPPKLKQCFAYCSLFPRDYKFDIERLIWLWMAQGFIVSVEVGHAYFMLLLRRCFFQDVERDVFDNIVSCKMHDLMHDLAKRVGDECFSIDESEEKIDDNIRHVRLFTLCSSCKVPSWLVASLPIRSFLMLTNYYCEDPVLNLKEVLPCLRQLRALDLGSNFVYGNLLDSISELSHLRYLKVSVGSEYLPKGITRLQNLQSLDLYGSQNLIELPRDFAKLTNLRRLLIKSSVPLLDMPPRFGKLKHLQKLDQFIVGENNGLDALSEMSLTGELEICFKVHRQNATSEATRGNLKNHKLSVLTFFFDDEEEHVREAEELLKNIQLPSTIKFLEIKGWQGVRFPSWGRNELPNLVRLSIIKCSRCQHLPPFSKLPHLKDLKIEGCEELDLWDVKDDDGDNVDVGEDNDVNSCAWRCLKSLVFLRLSYVSKLKSLPSGIGSLTTLQELHIRSLENLETLPEWIGNLTQLRGLDIVGSEKLKAIPRSFRSLTALQKLDIVGCPQLESRCERPHGEDWSLIQHIPSVGWGDCSIM